MTEFQLHIRVFGFRIPSGETLIVDDDFVFQAIGSDDNPTVFALFRVSEDTDTEYRNCLLRLEKFADCYTFASGSAVRIDSGYGRSPIKDGVTLRLGFHGELSIQELVKPEKARKQFDDAVGLARLSLPKYLQIALTFYSRSRYEQVMDEVLIDLITALESMFLVENLELHYRLSLRVAYFLYPHDERQRKETFDLVYDMYKLRSKIVHGQSMSFSEKESAQLDELCGVVRKAISRLILMRSIAQKKNVLISMIDSIMMCSSPM